ncbi:MAG: hypothetical protein IKD87_07770 [Oscillospiraceae bacterium]|nr:hypothetical protein [Oscillospiraceae bacterium]
MNRKIRRPLCTEGKDALMKILRADPVVFDTLKKVIKQCYAELILLCASISALGAFVSLLPGSGGKVEGFGWLLIASSALMTAGYAATGRARKRNFDRCIADINETLREDVILQVYNNPVGGMYENDSYTVMRSKGNQTESLCSSLISVSDGAVRLIGSVCSAVFMVLLNPVASVPALLFSLLRARRLASLRNRYEEALDDLDAKSAEYREVCDALLASSGMEPDDIALSRAKAVAAVDESQAAGIALRNRLFFQSRIIAGVIILLFGICTIAVINVGLLPWFSDLLAVPSLLMLSMFLFFTSDHYSFLDALAKAEWDSIDLTTLKEEQQ